MADGTCWPANSHLLQAAASVGLLSRTCLLAQGCRRTSRRAQLSRRRALPPELARLQVSVRAASSVRETLTPWLQGSVWVDMLSGSLNLFLEMYMTLY